VKVALGQLDELSRVAVMGHPNPTDTVIEWGNEINDKMQAIDYDMLLIQYMQLSTDAKMFYTMWLNSYMQFKLRKDMVILMERSITYRDIIDGIIINSDSDISDDLKENVTAHDSDTIQYQLMKCQAETCKEVGRVLTDVIKTLEL
jgi:hypothetical protein